MSYIFYWHKHTSEQSLTNKQYLWHTGHIHPHACSKTRMFCFKYISKMLDMKLQGYKK